MPANHNFKRLVGSIIALCLLMGCSYLWGKKKKKTKFEQIAAILTLVENAPDFATKELYIKQVMALDPSKWVYLSSLYMEQADAKEQLEEKLFYLQRVLEVVDKHSIDYHSIKVYRELGELYYRNRKLPQALSFYKKMIEIEARYLNKRQKYNLFFDLLLAQYPADCLTLCQIYLDIGDRATALGYLRESSKYFYELQQNANKNRFSYLADKFNQLGQLYGDFGLHKEKMGCYETGLRFKLLDLGNRIDSGQIESAIENELKDIIGQGEVDDSEFITKGRIWAKFLLAKYYYESDLRELAVDLIAQVLDSNFEYLPNVGNIMTIIRYIPWKVVFNLEDSNTIHIMGHDQRLLGLVLKKYHNISSSFYKKLTLEDLHNWLLISLLAEDYTNVDLILKKALELKTKKDIRLWNIIMHNIGVVYFRKSDYNSANIYLKQYYDFAHDLVATFNLAVLYLAMNDFDNAHPLLVEYENRYPKTVFSLTVEKYLKISTEHLTANSPDVCYPIELEQSIVPIAK